MFVQELWRYPVKSMAGERVTRVAVGPLGFARDRIALVSRHGRVITSRTHPRLLGLQGTLDNDGVPRVSGHPWNSPEALALVQAAAGADSRLIRYEGAERFDVLPLLIATDGAIQSLGLDSRRLRPNIVIGGVAGLREREWENRRLRIGDVIVHAAQLRRRCVMTTYDPDTLAQDLNVLRKIVQELDGTMALDCSVIAGGIIEEGAAVTLQD